ncbi:hypothetical protein [Marinobacter zhanjiangensis]|uniref:Gluconate 2-dehydrogenase subunit 3 n=1 Tax=Marinobacter zhanjiangensis TaxID=578215 RepID=A0ABQ3B2S3_9GAMM|nr:hypothetical protein [Marinobacter zhanjiangensis]GGY75204.1 hypothetical protein GCM10007071_23030 [Marinobacter zhanjiangensis]
MKRERETLNHPLNPGRRRVLVGSGVLGAAAAVAPGLLVPGRAHADLDNSDVQWTTEQLRAALEALRNDTFFGLVAFAVPGDDPYSQQQGVATGIPGGIGTRADLYLAGGIDRVVPLPPQFMNQLLNGIGAYLDAAPLSIPDDAAANLGDNGEWVLENLDASLGRYLEGDVPNSIMLTLLLNLVANQVIEPPGSGPFVAPFSNLSWEQKGRVMAALDGENSWLRNALRWTIPDAAFRDAAPGVLQALISFVIRIASFASYNEFAVFDPENLTVAERPLGWVLSGYEPDAPPIPDGGNDFMGYYQGRRSADNA